MVMGSPICESKISLALMIFSLSSKCTKNLQAGTSSSLIELIDSNEYSNKICVWALIKIFSILSMYLLLRMESTVCLILPFMLMGFVKLCSCLKFKMSSVSPPVSDVIKLVRWTGSNLKERKSMVPVCSTQSAFLLSLQSSQLTTGCLQKVCPVIQNSNARKFLLD